MKENSNKISFAFIAIATLALVFLGSSMLVSAVGVGSNAKVTRYVVDTHGKYSGVITAIETIRPSNWLSNGQSYSLVFSPGLPACLDTEYSFANCPSNSRLDRAGINLRIKGQNYQVSHLTTNARSVSSVTLSKGVVDRIVQVGHSISTPDGYSIGLEVVLVPRDRAASVGLVVTNVARSTERVTVNVGDAPTKVLDNLYVQVPDAFYVQAMNMVANQILPVGGSVSTSDGYTVRVDAISAPQAANRVSSIGLTVTNSAGASEFVTVTAGDAPTGILGNSIQVPNAYYVQSGNSTAKVVIFSGSNSSARIIASSGNMVLRNGVRLTNSPVYNGWNAVITSSLMGRSPAITGIGLAQRR